MLRTKLCGVLICAAAMAPAGVSSHAQRADSEFVAALGAAIAAQGNQALRAIRRDARLALLSQKPAPLDALIREVKLDLAPIEVVQHSL